MKALTGWIPSTWRSLIAGNHDRSAAATLLFAAAISLLSLLATAVAGESPSVIDTIIVEGNKVTRRAVILHEIKLRPGMTADPEEIEHDRLRLESTGLFSRVQSQVTKDGGNTTLVFRVTELWYIWPGIYMSVDKDRPTERIDIGLFLSHNNFRGRGEKLMIVGWVGSTHGGKIDWQVPYLGGGPKWFLKLHGKFSEDKDPESVTGRFGVETSDYRLGGEIGHRFNLQTRVWSGMEVEARRFDWDLEDPRLNGNLPRDDGRHNLVKLSLGFRHDTRYYKPWPRNGIVFNSTVQVEKSTDDAQVFYLRPDIALVKYIPLHTRMTIAGKVHSGVSIGESPWYRNYLLNRFSGIRTPLTEDGEGIHYFGAAAELRGDLLPITYITIKTFEPLSQYTRDLKFGISGTLFTDMRGVGGESTNPFDYTKSDIGGWDVAYGAGLVFHIPYREIIRVEYSRSARFPEAGFVIMLRVGPSLG